VMRAGSVAMLKPCGNLHHRAQLATVFE